jgi:alpha-L-arabinofuranosidase
MTNIGVEAGVSYPWNWEKEMEKTLSTVAREMEKTFKTVKESIRKSMRRETVVCSNCKERNFMAQSIVIIVVKSLNKTIDIIY